MKTPLLCLTFPLSAGLLAAQVPESPIASAPPADTEIALDLLEVSGDRGESLTVPSIDAARAHLQPTPGGVEVVDAARYLRGRASTVDDTFALSPGVIAQSRFGSDEARLSIRGSGIQRTFHGRGLRILQDGVPLNLADGGFDMQAFEPLAAAHVNIWRGPSALARGGTTLGGAIEYVSRTGRGTPTADARVEAGSWGYVRAGLAAGGSRADLDGHAVFIHQQQNGFREHAEQRNDRLFANAGLRLGDQAETRFFLAGITTESELPGNLTLAQTGTDPRAAAPGNLALDQRRDFTLLRLANRTSVRTGATTWDFVGAWSGKDLDHPIFQVVDQRSDDFTLGATGTHSGAWFGTEHRVRAGTYLTWGQVDAANYVNNAGRRGALVSRADLRASNLEFSVEDQIRLARDWTLVAGGAWALSRRASDRVSGTAIDYDLDYDRVMPRIGLRWDRDGVQVFGNIAGSFEPPSFSEAVTLAVPREAQTATSFEVGTRGGHGAFRWDVTAYHARIDHELLSLDADNNPATPAATVNADATIHAGLECAGEVDLLARDGGATRLVLRGAWTWGRFRFDDDATYGDNTLAGLPEHVVRGELTWEGGAGWYAGPTVEWADRTFIDHRNSFSAPGHVIWGVRLGRRSARGLSWFLEGRNLGDARYAATTGVIEDARGLDQPQFLPGDGRSAYGGVEWQW